MFSKRQQQEYRAIESIIIDSVASIVRRNGGTGQNFRMIPSNLQQISVGEFLQMKGKIPNEDFKRTLNILEQAERLGQKIDKRK